MAPGQAVSAPLAFLLNVLALCLVVTAFAFAVFLNHSVVLVWKPVGCRVFYGFSTIDLERYFSRNVWNQMFASGGMLVGSLTLVAFLLHDRYLGHVASRRQRRGEPTLPPLVRPITRASKTEPGAGFSLGLVSLLGLALFSAFVSVTAVSSLGMHLKPFTTGSPIPQVRTSELRKQYYDPDGPDISIQVPSTDMTPILYRSAYRRALDASQPLPYSEEALVTRQYLTDKAPHSIGWARYHDLRTRGVGASPASLTEAYPYHALADGFTIQSLRGSTIGTNITATCRDTTGHWNWTRVRLEPVGSVATLSRSLYRFTIFPAGDKRGAAYVMLREPSEIAIRTWLQDWQQRHEGYKMMRQFFFVARVNHTKGLRSYSKNDKVPGVTVVECDYSGYDVRQAISVESPNHPIKFEGELEQLGPISAEDMYAAARAINLAIDHDHKYGGHLDGRGGGTLMDGLIDGGLMGTMYRSNREFDFARLFEDILTDAAQSYFSVYRHAAEVWGAPWNDDGSGGELRARALRLGGGGWAWIAVIVALGLMPLVAVLRMTWAVCLEWIMEDEPEGASSSFWLEDGAPEYTPEDESQEALLPPALPPKDDEAPPPYTG